MPPQIEISAGLTTTCCTTLQYLEGAAYIAIVLAVLGVPQLLTHYFDRRYRRRDRAEAERIRRQDLATAERIRREEREAAEQARREEREVAERTRREEREAAERRHQEMMTVLIGLLERNGHSAPTDQSAAIEQLQRRIAELETEIALSQNGDPAVGEG